MRKLLFALTLTVATSLVTVSAALADPPPGPIQVAGQSAGTSQQAAAGSSATQVDPSNTNISIRVLSPGNDGNVSQANTVGSSASAGNQGATSQTAGQSAAGAGGIQSSQQQAGTSQLAAALSAAEQYGASNVNAPVRVLSPGDGGDVTQANNAGSRADAGNASSTSQGSTQSQAGAPCGCDASTAPVQTADQGAQTEQGALAGSAATQDDPSNTNVAVRVLSPGNSGDVSQANTASSSAFAGNHADTSQGTTQTQAPAANGIQSASQDAATGQHALGGSLAHQDDPSNSTSPVNVESPGNGGSTTQSNTAGSSASAGNGASTTQNAAQSQAGAPCGCSNGPGIQVAGQQAQTGQDAGALSAALQRFGGRDRCGCGGASSGNEASPVRVESPGDGGSVDQANTATSRADAGNRADTTQSGSQSLGGGGLQIQALGQEAGTLQRGFAGSLAGQLGASNDASPTRVESPGGDGSVQQANDAGSSASSGNDAATSQYGAQATAAVPCGCGGRLPIQVVGQSAHTGQAAAALSAALQLLPRNDSSPTRVWSPGGGGDVAQASSGTSRGDSGNRAESGQGVSQTS